ncbi:hypothetical protein [Mycobacterium sp. 852002-40037_SCH5390672]|uniref:hypothetical protein n=1 Tax=Mycobacterium sp. 852002-40037_SCH5390672 TaxID=1834089 RepID=UPI000805567C|nr:hypothetical protein [Mycobacterium sp. 852002-40037_SCH5390672]OBB95145.1 hypothetical protein A5782_08070 [Mycobacterium sp. 852002-40037_SCH5390672]
MADRLDVAARLAEGRVAVEHTQTYVQACHALGYQNPDLTMHPAQVRERYAAEDGLDLRALDRDCAELRAAGVVAAEALRMQRAQVAELAAAWTGSGGDAAVQLLQRHCDTADAVATELRAAAQRCESLRDNLWYLVDSKVATAIAVDDRARLPRPAWLAAAAAVTAGDRDSAADVVRQQVMPYVDNDIRNDWLTAMRSASDGVETSYAMVIDKMAAVPTTRFECPGDLGRGFVPTQLAPPVSVAPVPPADPAPTLMSAVPASGGATPDSVAPAPPPVAAAPAPPADWGAALGDALGMPAGDLGGMPMGDVGGLGGGGLGGGLGGGGGLLGLAGRIVDAVGGLIGSTGDGLGGADSLAGADDENAFDENPFHPEDPEHTGDVIDDKTAADDKAAEHADDPAKTDQVQPVGPPEPSAPSDPIQPVEAPAPAGAPPADTSPPGEPPAPPAAPSAEPAPAANEGSTPCEIAADQLPQAGQ